MSEQCLNEYLTPGDGSLNSTSSSKMELFRTGVRMRDIVKSGRKNEEMLDKK